MNLHIKSYLKSISRNNYFFKRKLTELKKSQYFTIEQLNQLQNKKLQKIIRHCYKNVPYYRELMQKLNLKPDDILTKDDLKKLPFSDKFTVRDNFDKLLAKNIPKFLCYETKTSGTTGTPGKVVWDPWSINHEYAANKRFYETAGDAGLRRIVLRGLLVLPVNKTSPPFWKYDHAANELILSSYHLTKKNINIYFDEINKFKPDVLNAYPSTAYLLANYLKEAGKKLNLKVVFTSSENLSDSQRKFIENFFMCTVYDWYGEVERVSAICQCEKGTYHIQEDYSITELVETEAGVEIVGTHLYNYAMPLIRYKTSDTVERENKKCSCGRNFRTIAKITGKGSGYYHIVTKDGIKITSFGYIPMGVNNIVETQFVQEKIDELIINITTNGKFTAEDKQKLIENALERTSKDMKIIINEVLEIPRGPNGKFQSIINKLKTE